VWLSLTVDQRHLEMTKKKLATRRSGLVEFDPDKLERAILRMGISKTELSNRSDVSRATVIRAFKGEGIFASSAKVIADFLGHDPSELRKGVGSVGTPEAETGGEWEVDDYLGPWITASNSIQYRVCRMRHRYVEDYAGRGKCYDLLNPSIRNMDQLRDCLVRHPTVCSRIGVHRHVAENLATFPEPGGEFWWVVDRWVEAESLEEKLDASSFEMADLPRLAVEMALGLSALHAVKTVFRELAPNRVLLAKNDGRVILSDFELAKILDVDPTVSASWKEDPFRAPEVERGQVSVQADLFSWGRVVTRVACGKPPPMEEETSELRRVGLPKAVVDLLIKCLSPFPSDRPKDIGRVLRTLRRQWPECFKGTSS